LHLFDVGNIQDPGRDFNRGREGKGWEGDILIKYMFDLKEVRNFN